MVSPLVYSIKTMIDLETAPVLLLKKTIYGPGGNKYLPLGLSVSEGILIANVESVSMGGLFREATEVAFSTTHR